MREYRVLKETIQILPDNYDEDLLCRCYFIGYGRAQIATTITGLSPDAQDVIETSDFLGYKHGSVRLIFDESETK